jgi:hypothetical protein
MTTSIRPSRVHLLGEPFSQEKASVSVDTFGGLIHVEWSPQAAVTPLGQLPFFVELLKTADLFDPWVADCPLEYRSPNAPAVRDILGTTLLAILAGRKRYAHIAAIRSDGVNPALRGTQWHFLQRAYERPRHQEVLRVG